MVFLLIVKRKELMPTTRSRSRETAKRRGECARVFALKGSHVACSSPIIPVAIGLGTMVSVRCANDAGDSTTACRRLSRRLVHLGRIVVVDCLCLEVRQQ